MGWIVGIIGCRAVIAPALRERDVGSYTSLEQNGVAELQAVAVKRASHCIGAGVVVWSRSREPYDRLAKRINGDRPVVHVETRRIDDTAVENDRGCQRVTDLEPTQSRATVLFDTLDRKQLAVVKNRVGA